MTVRHGDVTVEWLGYATARIEGPDGTVVYTDPGRYGCLTGEWSADSEAAADAHPPARDYDARDGDLVVVTHDHHYDSDGVRRVARDDATVVVYDAVHPPGIDRDVEDLDALPQEVVRVDDEYDGLHEDVVVRTVPAYNLPDGPNTDASGEPLHPEGFGCGYLLTLGDTTVSPRAKRGGARHERSEVTVFWPGDSDVLEGHAALDVDVFCPPIGNFTMDRHDAAELAEELAPGVVVPIHYNTFAALEADSAAFAADVAKRGVPVALDER
jgi:L-ascorbate metabolism protein UlaG (beta-lactamase superfamily)